MQCEGIFHVFSEGDSLPFSDIKLRFFFCHLARNLCGLIEPLWAKGMSVSRLWQEEGPLFYTHRTLSESKLVPCI